MYSWLGWLILNGLAENCSMLWKLAHFLPHWLPLHCKLDCPSLSTVLRPGLDIAGLESGRIYSTNQQLIAGSSSSVPSFLLRHKFQLAAYTFHRLQVQMAACVLWSAQDNARYLSLPIKQEHQAKKNAMWYAKFYQVFSN